MNQALKQLTLQALIVAATGSLVGCGTGSASYSLLPGGQDFKQNASTVNTKIDLLWVIDNSSSMTPLQNNLTSNFNSFMNTFMSNGYDFHLAVTTTDAYKSGAAFMNNPTYSLFRDGATLAGGAPGHTTGIFDILPSTPNLLNVFMSNASQGINGSGDERAFSSFKATLNNAGNAGFLRANSFLAVIILSDEDDFSDPNRAEGSWQLGGVADHSYTNPGLESVDSYVSYLDTLTGTSALNRRYNVSAITVEDSSCLAAHAPAAPSTIIGQRYMDIVGKTNGVAGSICDASYATALNSIQQRIIELTTQFYLDRLPNVSTLVVTVNNVVEAQNASNGWTYSSASNSIVFHGTGVPAAGASIHVDYTPAGVL
jgi:hypothetical protein